MTKDLNKNISSIQYNLLNLPSNISYSNGRSATYVYGADGKKLHVGYTVPGSASTTADYCGGKIYENNVLKQILIDCGYITFSGTTPQYHFYLQDHLGNNRVVVSAGGTVEQVNHYYPYGGLMGESTSGDLQRFKYNGKELDRMHGLDWLDYGARHFDGARGQWNGVDRLAEKYPYLSPYHFGKDNPLRYKDLDGNDNFDVVVGWGIGLVTNIIPGTSGLRDEYIPNDATDYNNALQGADNAAMAIGGMANDAGNGMMAGGAAIAATGAVSVVASGGTAAMGGVTAVGVGKVTTIGGVLLKGLGVMMQMNAANNKGEGYEKGKNGTQTNSKTIWKSKGKDNARIDVENPNPSKRKGQIHYQKGAKKYIYDSKKKEFKGAPNSVNKLLEDDEVKRAVKKGEKYLNEL